MTSPRFTPGDRVRWRGWRVLDWDPARVKAHTVTNVSDGRLSWDGGATWHPIDEYEREEAMNPTDPPNDAIWLRPSALHTVTADPSPRWRRPLTTRCIADETGDIYMKRWYLIETPWFGVKLHHIRRPDQDRALHDHPWAFAALILRGGYIEHVPNGPPFLDGRSWRLGSSLRARRWRPGTVHRIAADGLHRIDSLPAGSSWSLVFTGRRKRLWGFSERPGDWVAWTDYETDWDGDAQETVR